MARTLAKSRTVLGPSDVNDAGLGSGEPAKRTEIAWPTLSERRCTKRFRRDVGAIRNREDASQIS